MLNSDSYAIKIGRASNVEKRLQSLQTSSPVPLEILKVVPMENLKKAQEVETYLHTKFRHLRLSGEWFRAAPSLKDYINRCDESYFKDTLLVESSPRSSIPLSEL
ncbi:GIY-YIG nuclease family protein [Nostoc linckia]|uniref:GIY-YIG nuclease family protein n=1 Tax=Nostoc linckia TaxID=92942 RepID=UPI00352B32CF